MRPKARYKTKQLVKLYFKPLKTGVKTPYLQYRSESNEIIREYCQDSNGRTYHIVPERTADDKKVNAAVMAAVMKLRADKELKIIEEGAGLKTSRSTNFLLKDLVERYTATLGESTVKTYTALLIHLPEGARLKDITPDFLRKWFVSMTTTTGGRKDGRGRRSEGLNPRSADMYAAKLHALVNFAIRKGWITSDPFLKLDKADRLKTESSQREFLTSEEVERMAAVEWTQDVSRRAFLFSCYCGLRVSDLRALTWSKVVAIEGRLFLDVKAMVKTGEAVFLPLSEKAVALMGERGSDEATVFSLPSQGLVNIHIKKAAKLACITKSISFHTSRHSFATNLLTKGVELYTVSKLLGHKNINTTQIYAEVVTAAKMEAVDKL